MATLTAEDILTWPPADYDHPHDPFIPVIYGVEIPLMVGMTVFLAGRFYSRTILVRDALGADDWTMLVAYILAMTMSICQIVLIRYGLGRHLYDVRPEWINSLGALTVATQCLFGPTSALTKISICLTYLRLFPSKNNRWFNYILIAILGAFGIAVAITMALQCRPISLIWAIYVPQSEKNCVDGERFYIAVAALNSLTDFLVYLWPVPYLWRIKLSLVKRLGLIVCFGVGVLICVAGIVRITWQVKFAASWDQSYNGAVVFVIVAIEINLGVMCGCLPGIRPLMSRLFPKLGNSGYGSYRGPSNNLYINSNTPKRGVEHTDLGSIRVTKDVELSVRHKDMDEVWKKRQQQPGRSDSEEWIFRP